MWSTAKVASNARRDGDREWETGPYIPSFLETERSNLAMDAGTLGEVRIFEGTESADEPTNPPSVFVPSECNQLMEPLESTDGSMYPARVELTETSEQFLSPRETRPLVVTALDTVEDSLGFISNNSEAVTTAVLVEHAKTRAVVYSNSGPGDIIIIDGDEDEKYPVMVPDTTEEPGCFRTINQCQVRTGIPHQTRIVAAPSNKNGRLPPLSLSGLNPANFG